MFAMQSALVHDISMTNLIIWQELEKSINFGMKEVQ